MIRQVTAALAADFLRAAEFDPILGARSKTLFHVFGPDAERKHAAFWLQSAPDGRPACSLSLFDGWVVASADEAACDFDELGAFLCALGDFSGLEASPRICALMAETGRLDTSSTMAYAGPPVPEPTADVVWNPPLRDFIRTVDTANEWFHENTTWDTWYVCTSHMIRHGLGFCCAVYEGGVPVSVGGVFAMSDRYAVIGALSTLSDSRGKGYAACIMRALTARCLALGKTPALLTASDSLVRYYRKLGFTEHGKWAEILRKRTG